jgi:CPA1 family monovalent cation:H+ antiporter
MFDIAAICLVVTAIFSYLNHRYVRFPPTIGVMVIALTCSLAIVALNAMGLAQWLHEYEQNFLRSIDFSAVLMEGMLSMLLFAGALHVDLSELRALKWPVAALALLGTLASTLVVGIGLWWTLPWIGLELPFIHALLFGALISPTDPIAVAGILKSAGAPKRLELVISGESLFNDGVGVVIFALLLGVLATGDSPDLGAVAVLLAREAGGGIVFGLALGTLTYHLIKSVNEYKIEVLLTLAAVLGGYGLAAHLHISAPLAIVVTGLVIGNHGRAHAMSDMTRQYVDMFWELIDEILNGLLFVLIGMEVVLVSFSAAILRATLVAIGVTLVARTITVGAPVYALAQRFDLPRGSAQVLVWGGLRGGISVALALSLPPGDARDLILSLTYGVVVFSILVQGLSIGRVVRRAFPVVHPST